MSRGLYTRAEVDAYISERYRRGDHPEKEVAPDRDHTVRPFAAVLESMMRIPRLAVQLHDHIESPIEKVFGAHLLAVLQDESHREPVMVRQDKMHTFGPGHVLLVPQFKWKRWRFDFAVVVPGIKRAGVFIECDGAEFHSTDAQKARDAEKDLDAKAVGIPVLRFTGTEISRHSWDCARLTLDAINKHLAGLPD